MHLSLDAVAAMGTNTNTSNPSPGVLQEIGTLTSLTSLCFTSSHKDYQLRQPQHKGALLEVITALPALTHLDLTLSGVNVLELVGKLSLEGLSRLVHLVGCEPRERSDWEEVEEMLRGIEDRLAFASRNSTLLPNLRVLGLGLAAVTSRCLGPC